MTTPPHTPPMAASNEAEPDQLEVARAEGDAYAGRLATEGLLIEHRVVPGRDHYFLDGNDPVQARGLLDDLAGHLPPAGVLRHRLQERPHPSGD